MNLRKLVLLTSATYLVDVATAHAGIETAIAAAIQGFLLSSTAIAATATGTIALFAANLIVAGAVVGASVLFGGARPRGGAIKPSDAKSTFETGESSVMEGVGLVRVGGLKAFGNTDGSTRVRLIARLQGPIDAVEAYYLGGREVTVEPNGDVSSPPWARPGGSWCNWKDKKGDGTETAWSALMSMFPSLWTSAHKVQGIAQSLLTLYNPGLSEPKYLSLYQNGVPDSEERIRASLIYDPRSGLTAWSDNGILVSAHVLRRDPAFTFDRFDWDLIAEQADKADGPFATLAGTVKRGAVSGIWAWESERGETMQQFLDSIGAEIRLTEAGKIWFELIDDDPVVEVGFTPEDIYDFTWGSGPEAIERPNIVRVKYYSRERNFELTEINLEGFAWSRIDDEVERYGPKYLDIDLPYQPHCAVAQWLARRRFALARADRGRAVMNMVGLAAWGRLYAEIEEPDLGDVEKVRMDPPRIDDAEGSVEIPFTVWPNLPAWDPETDEAPTPEELPELGYETDMITPDAPNGVIQITFPTGAKEMRIGFALPAQAYDTVEANFRTYTGGLPNTWQGMGEIGGFCAVADGDYLGQSIDMRVRVFNGDDGSHFSTVSNMVVGVSNVPCIAPQVVSGEVVTDPAPVRLEATVSAPDIQCAAIRLTKLENGVLVYVETRPVRPTQQETFINAVADFSPGSITQWVFHTLTSDGTSGAALVFAYTAP